MTSKSIVKNRFIRKLFYWIASCCIPVAILSCQAEPQSPQAAVKVGLDRVDEAVFRELFADKTIGIVTNHTAVNADGKYITEVFQEMPGVKIGALFGPEHGIRGQAEAGEKVDSETDPLQGVPIYSLYGKTRKPTPEMLNGIDVLVFDIQDVGARFYTYIYTMSYAMEGAAENDIPFVVLDRPNPVNGVDVQGNILDTTFSSFIGRFPIPQRHGMTIGELAQLFNGEGWLGEKNVDLTVVPMGNWKRHLWYDQSGLTFVKPSPNIPTPNTATVYPAICLIEGTNLSEGRGTARPFWSFGAPWLNSTELATRLNDANLPGVQFRDTLFIPVRIPGAAENPKYQDKTCRGVTLRLNDRNQLDIFKTGITIIDEIQRLHPDSLQWRESFFDKLVGTDQIRKAIQDNSGLDAVLNKARRDVALFEELRKRYLLY